MNFHHIMYEENDTFAILTLNRPDVFHAMNKLMKAECTEVILKVSQSPQLQTLIITATGKAFCSGQDLKDRAATGDSASTRDLGTTLETEWNPLVRAIYECPKIVISAVNGVCAGAGVSLALSADLVFSTEASSFNSGFPRIGLACDAGSSFFLPRSLGSKRALDLFLSPRPITAKELFNQGIINALSTNPLEQAIQYARHIASLAPLAVQSIKKNLQYGCTHTFEEVLAFEVTQQRLLGRSADFAEGVTAFAEKRQPHFKGK